MQKGVRIAVHLHLLQLQGLSLFISRFNLPDMTAWPIRPADLRKRLPWRRQRRNRRCHQCLLWFWRLLCNRQMLLPLGFRGQRVPGAPSIREATFCASSLPPGNVPPIETLLFSCSLVAIVLQRHYMLRTWLSLQRWQLFLFHRVFWSPLVSSFE